MRQAGDVLFSQVYRDRGGKLDELLLLIKKKLDELLCLFSRTLYVSV